MAQGQRIAYKRVSTAEQNTARQLEGEGPFDKVFEDKASGKNLERPAFEALMNHVREGDTVFVHSMDRLARNLGDLLKTVEGFNAKGVVVRFVKENLAFEPGNEANPMGKLTLSLLGAFAEFERALIRERQREGIAIAKAKGGVFKGGNNKLKPETAEKIRQRLSDGVSPTAIAKELGVSRQTVYTYAGGLSAQ